MSTHQYPSSLVAIVRSLVVMTLLLPMGSASSAAQQAHSKPHRITASGPDSLTDGLVAYYSFDDGTAADRSGNQNDGTPHGSLQITQGIVGQALRFGGYYNPSYIVVPNSATLSFSDNFTFSLWFNIQSNTSMDAWGQASEYGNQALLGKSGDRSGLVLQASRSTTDGLWYPSAFNGRCCGSSGKGLLSDYGIVLNEWHMIALTHGNGSVRLFVDGVLRNELSTNEFNLNQSMSGQPIHIGVQQDATWYPLNGMLDEIRIYRRVLDVTEIQALYCQGESCIPTLRATPVTIPADDTSTAIITLSGISTLTGHRERHGLGTRAASWVWTGQTMLRPAQRVAMGNWLMS